MLKDLKTRNKQYASIENYEQAKRMKNEINRIRNIVINVASHSKPRVISPLKNAQTSIEKHNKSLNRSVFDISQAYKTKQSYENFRSAKKNTGHVSYFNVNKDGHEVSDDEVISTANQRSVTNLKSSGIQKRSGILKFNTNVYNSNNISMMADESGQTSMSASISNLLKFNDQSNNGAYQKPNKKQIRMIDPKIRINKMNSDNEAPVRSDSRTDNTPFIPKNSDHRVVPGALMKKPIDFSQVIEEVNEQGGDEAIFDDDQIDPSQIHRAEPYYGFF